MDAAGMDAGKAFDRTIDGLRTGDPARLREFVEIYRPALERLAERRIHPGLQRRVGPESIAQSVVRTFLRRASLGQFVLRDEDELWSLLCAIALTKVRERVRHHRRLKRDVGRDRTLDDQRPEDLAHDEAQRLFEDQMDVLLDAFSDEERLILGLRMRGETQAAIGELLSCSERTVRRILGGLETRLRAALVAG